MADRPAPPDDEEPTSEMVGAGVRALANYDRDYESHESAVRRIYRAMRAAIGQDFSGFLNLKDKLSQLGLALPRLSYLSLHPLKVFCADLQRPLIKVDQGRNHIIDVELPSCKGRALRHIFSHRVGNFKRRAFLYDLIRGERDRLSSVCERIADAAD